MLFSVVVPVYGTAASLEALARRVDAVFAEHPELEHELILVDDASPNPDTWPTIQRLARDHRSVRGVQLMRNFGQHAATLCGFRESRGDFVVTMDDDLQHAPEDLPRFFEKTDWDVVIGQFDRKNHGVMKRITSRAKGWFDRVVIGKPKGLQMTAYRMLSRPVVDAILAIRTPNPFIPALVFTVCQRVTGVPVRHDRRTEGRSVYTTWKRIRLFSNLIMNNSSLGLRLVGNLGMIIAVLSLVFAGYTAVRRLMFHVSVPGWTSLFVAVLFLGGLSLFCMGMMGEHLIRIIASTEHRPTFVVRARAGDDVRG